MGAMTDLPLLPEAGTPCVKSDGHRMTGAPSDITAEAIRARLARLARQISDR